MRQVILEKPERARDFIKNPEGNRPSLESMKGTGLLWKAWKGPDFFGKHGKDRTCL
jgi:hypothetical protein